MARDQALAPLLLHSGRPIPCTASTHDIDGASQPAKLDALATGLPPQRERPEALLPATLADAGELPFKT